MKISTVELKLLKNTLKNDINDEFKEIINDEAVDKKLQCLTKTVKDLQTKNSKLEAGIISERHGELGLMILRVKYCIKSATV